MNERNDDHGSDQVHEQILEQLSAYMDGELPESERPLLNKRLESDTELRARWSRYHMVRDVLHNHAPTRAHHDISARVHAALSGEADHRALPSLRISAFYKPVVGVAIAASVALLAILGVQRVTLETVPSPATVAAVTTPEPTAADYQRVAGARWDLQQPELEDNLNQYLLSHKRHAGGNGMPGMLPYVRIVGYDTSE